MKLKLNAQPRLPSLKALHTFEVASRCASFTEAAEELNVTLGAVSRQIRHLENELGVELFHRKGNAVALNETGKRLAIDVTRALTLLQKASDRARPEQQQTLKLTCTLGIASHWLAARLPALRRADPDVSLVLDANESLRDLASGEADIAIRYSPTDNPPPHSHELLADAFAPLASPSFLAAYSAPITAADLASPSTASGMRCKKPSTATAWCSVAWLSLRTPWLPASWFGCLAKTNNCPQPINIACAGRTARSLAPPPAAG